MTCSTCLEIHLNSVHIHEIESVCVCVCERERETETETERDEKKKQEGIKQRGYLVTSCKEQRLKKAKNERGAVREGIRESDTRGSCA